MKRVSVVFISLLVLFSVVTVHAANFDQRIQRVESRIDQLKKERQTAKRKLTKTEQNTHKRKKFERIIDTRDNRIAKFQARIKELQEKENAQQTKEAKREARLAKRKAKREARLAERQAKREARLAERQAEREARLAERQAEREARLAERQAEREARIAAKKARRAERLANRAANRKANTSPDTQLALTQGSELVLSWRTPHDSVIGYYVYAGSSKNNTDQLVADVTNFNQQAPEFNVNLHRDVQSADNVCFRVKAYSNSAVSEYSNAVCTSRGS